MGVCPIFSTRFKVSAEKKSLLTTSWVPPMVCALGGAENMLDGLIFLLCGWRGVGPVSG